MKLRFALWILLCARGTLWGAVSTLTTNDLASARIEGSNSLARFKALITPANYQLMGFGSTNDLLLATNAEPLVIYTSVQSQLNNYHLGQSFDPLLDPTPRRVIIPVLVGTNVTSSTTLRAQPGAVGGALVWATENWGQPRLIRELMATYRSIPNSEIRSGTVPFAVELPVFDIWLLGYYDPKNQLVLRSTVDLPLGPITVHRNEIVSSAAMYQLGIRAQRYNGLPN
jgi:hypothetical protein